VGAQVFSCLKCPRCLNDNENYCPDQVDTYNAPYPDGVMAQGGYSTNIRVDEKFVFPIPDNISDEQACPMLCAGLTCYSPLVRNGVGPGSRVGIVGLGGLVSVHAEGWTRQVGTHAAKLKPPASSHRRVTLPFNSPKRWERPSPSSHTVRARVRMRCDSERTSLSALPTLISPSHVSAGRGGCRGCAGGIPSELTGSVRTVTGKDLFDFILSCADANAIPLAELLGLVSFHCRASPS
jgi:hypothetical protein